MGFSTLRARHTVSEEIHGLAHGLRIQRCHKLWHRSQMQLRSGVVAVAVAVAALIWPWSWELLITAGVPFKKKKEYSVSWLFISYAFKRQSISWDKKINLDRFIGKTSKPLKITCLWSKNIFPFLSLNFYLCGLYLLIFTTLELKIETIYIFIHSFSNNNNSIIW